VKETGKNRANSKRTWGKMNIIEERSLTSNPNRDKGERAERKSGRWGGEFEGGGVITRGKRKRGKNPNTQRNDFCR